MQAINAMPDTAVEVVPSSSAPKSNTTDNMLAANQIATSTVTMFIEKSPKYLVNIPDLVSLINVEREYFVYDGQEVIKTGRVATKEHDAIGWQGSKKVLETVCEITPVVRAGEYAYKKWVKESELFVINDTYADQELTNLEVDQLRTNDSPTYDAVDDILKQLRDRNQDGPKT